MRTHIHVIDEHDATTKVTVVVAVWLLLLLFAVLKFAAYAYWNIFCFNLVDFN